MTYYSFENGIQTDTEILFEKSIYHYCELDRINICLLFQNILRIFFQYPA